MNDIREDLKAWIDGELTEDRAEQVRQAVEADPVLQQEVEYMKLLGLEIRRAAVEPPIAGRAEVISRLKEPPKSGVFKFIFRNRLLAGTAATLFIGVICISILNRGPLGGRILGGAPGAEAESAARWTNGAVPAEDGAKMETEAPAAGGAGGVKAKSAVPDREGQDRGGFESKAPSTSPSTPLLDNRMVIKNADLSVRVDDVPGALTKASNIAQVLGGFTFGSRATKDEDSTPNGEITIRVPATRFESALKQIKALGLVLSEATSGEDVTAQVADLGARIKVLKAEEDSYVTMLRGARRVGEMLEIKERLSQVRQEIESSTAQVNSLKNLASLSTIHCSFSEKVKIAEGKGNTDPGGFEQAWNGAVNGLSGALSFLGRAVIVLFVYSPIWLPALVVIWLFQRRMKASSQP